MRKPLPVAEDRRSILNLKSIVLQIARAPRRLRISSILLAQETISTGQPLSGHLITGSKILAGLVKGTTITRGASGRDMLGPPSNEYFSRAR